MVDLAQALQEIPSRVKRTLWQLADRGIVTNDRFDVLRRLEADLEEPKVIGRVNLRAMRQTRLQHPEGRWALLPWGQPEAEKRAVFQVQLLLERYGIVSKELAQLDATLMPWRVLYEVLSRLEMNGEVRRGYFVEGLAGAQFALPEAVEQLTAISRLPADKEPAILVHALDPTNLYGPNAPLGWPFPQAPASETSPEQGIRWAKRNNNWLITQAGHILLAIESGGKRLWTSPRATPDQLLLAIQKLPDILRTGFGTDIRAKLTIEEWNGSPVTASPARPYLESVGFVNDYHSMCLYAAWS